MATLQERLEELIDAIGTDYKAIWANTGNKTDLDTTDKSSLVAAINEIFSGGGSGGYTDEQAQDAVGTIFADTATIDITYTDATPELKADVKDNSITYAKIQDVSAASRILGRLTASAGDIEELTAANVKTILALVKGDVGLGNVDNTSDANKPISTATQTALDTKGTLDDGAANNDATKVWSADKTYDEINARVAAIVGSASASYDTFQELQALMELDDTETAGIITALGLRLRLDGVAQTVSDANKLVARTTIGAQSAAAIGDPDTDLVALYTAAKA